MKLNARSGAAIAAAAAGIVVAGAATVATPASAGDYKVKCFGLNACKGHGSCKALRNACKGHNACKGEGFKMLSKSKCKAMGGRT